MGGGHGAIIPLYLDKSEYFPGCSEADSLNTLAAGDKFSHSSTKTENGANGGSWDRMSKMTGEWDAPPQDFWLL